MLHLTIYDALKAGSILLTGAFGIVGLSKDFRNKDNRVTGWGYVSLAGIIISALIGFVVQLNDISKQKADAQDQLAVSQQLTRNSTEALFQLQKSLSNLEGMQLHVQFRVPCEQGFQDFCRYARSKPRSFPGEEDPHPDWRYWPVGNGHFTIHFYVQFFHDEKALDSFLAGSAQAQMRLYAAISSDANPSLLLISVESDNSVILHTRFDPEDLNKHVDGPNPIQSRVDLSGTPVVINQLYANNTALHFEPVLLMMSLKDGEQIYANGPFEQGQDPRHYLFKTVMPIQSDKIDVPKLPKKHGAG
jgi:hypothetical protein